MRGSSRLLFVAVAVGLALCAMAAPAALAAQPRVKILSDGQGAILSKGSVEAKVTATVRRGRRLTLAVKGRSSTFDQPRLSALTEARTLRFHRSGSKTVNLALSAAGRSEIKSCEARTLQVSAGGATDSADLVRQSALLQAEAGRPLKGRASATSSGPRAARSACCPSPTTSTPPRIRAPTPGGGSPSGRDAMPTNVSDVHIDPAPYRRNDGFSPGQSIVAAGAGPRQPDRSGEHSTRSRSTTLGATPTATRRWS